VRIRTSVRIGAGLVLALQLAAGATQEAEAQALPEGFSITDVSGPLDGDATTFALLPDERILVGNQFSGRVQVIVDGALQTDPIFEVPNLRTSNEQGLLGIAVDPDFPDSNYVYLFHSLLSSVNRVSRYTIEGDLLDPRSDNLTIDEGSERTLIEFQDLRFNHNGGTLRFGSDRTLYISHGDDADISLVQNLTNLFGAILRINRDGSVPADNPAFDPEPDGARAEIFAFGLRNPFRFAVDPLTDELFIGDVGPEDVEELNISRGGENFGWPSYLAADPYRSQIPLATSEQTLPIHSYQHVGGMRSVIALLTYRQRDYPNDASFPPEYEGVHFFADFYAGPMRYLRSSQDGGWTAVEFANGFTRPVDAAIASDGGVYILEYGRSIRKIVYTGAGVGSEHDPDVPGEPLNLTQNYPNPFNGDTQFAYNLSAPSQITVSVFDVLGGHVMTLYEGIQRPGRHTLSWNGRDRFGLPVSTGVYFYRVDAGERSSSKAMSVAR